MRILSLLQRMVCAIAELESDRQLLVIHSGHKSKEPTVGLMQLLPKTAMWLMRYCLNVDSLFCAPNSSKSSLFHCCYMIMVHQG